MAPRSTPKNRRAELEHRPGGHKATGVGNGRGTEGGAWSKTQPLCSVPLAPPTRPALGPRYQAVPTAWDGPLPNPFLS